MHSLQGFEVCQLYIIGTKNYCKMKKNLILWMSALFLVISGMVSCSSDDDDEVKLSAEDLIGTRTCVGTVGYHGDSKGEWGTARGERRWYITKEPGSTHEITEVYYPVSFPNEFKKEGLKVSIEGDIYPYEFRGEYFIAGVHYYFIDLKEIKVTW